jgi:hypothetical protein
MPTAHEKAKETRQRALEQRQPGTLIIDGTSYVGGGLFLGPFRSELNGEGNWRPAQRMKIHVRKSLLPTPPEKKTKSTCAGHTWKVDEVAGQSPTEIAWIIKGIRWTDSPS